MYIVKCGKRYVTRNGKRTTDINSAYQIETLKDCALFMARVLNTSEISSSNIISIDNEDKDNHGFNINDATIEHGNTNIVEKKIFKPLNDDLICNDNYYKNAFESIDGLQNLFSDIKTIYNKVVNFNGYIKKLNNIYKETELEVCDIYHYIEFNNLNACDGFKIYKKLHDTLNKRRMIKDAIEALGILNEMFTDNDIDNLLNIIHSPNRCYLPRTDKSLFKEGI